MAYPKTLEGYALELRMAMEVALEKGSYKWPATSLKQARDDRFRCFAWIRVWRTQNKGTLAETQFDCLTIGVEHDPVSGINYCTIKRRDKDSLAERISGQLAADGLLDEGGMLDLDKEKDKRKPTNASSFDNLYSRENLDRLADEARAAANEPEPGGREGETSNNR